MVKTFFKRSLIGTIFLVISMSVFAESLERVVQHTVKTNPDVLSWTKVQKASNETVKQARSHYYPTLDVYGGVGREKSKNINTGGEARTLWRRELGVTVRQNVFEGLATYYDVKRTKAKTDADSYQVFGSSEDVALMVTEAYLNVLRYEKLVKIANDNLATHQSIYNKVKSRSNSGIAREADIYQATGRLALAKSNLVAVQNSYRNARTNYFKLTGLNPRELSMPRKPSDKWMPKSEHDAVRRALKYNPKMRVAVTDVDEAIAQHNISHHTAFPVIDVVLEARDNQNVNGAKGDSDNYSAYLDVHYNLFRGGHDVARQRETAYKAQEAAEIRNRTCREVIENMRLAWNNKMAVDLRLPTLDTHKKASVKTAIAYSDQFTVGKRTLLDLLDSENEKFSSASHYVDGLFDTYIMRYRILHAYGCITHFLGTQLPPTAQTTYDAYNPAANPVVVPRHSEADPDSKFVRSDSLHEELNEVASNGKPKSAKHHKVVAKKTHQRTYARQPSQRNVATRRIEKKTQVAQVKTVQKPKPVTKVAVVAPPKQSTPVNKQTAYNVKVGTFDDPKNVNNIVKSLQKHGMNGFIKELKTNDKKVYEVYVGPADTHTEAKNLLAQLKGIQLGGYIVKAT